ncbi:c2H2 type zinc-finger (2 copies) domain-containing protein [Hirsutella rhossiliensis]|uniref:C2H2 type zinc-finger (2 copies) domain-containing protein n=1 Tax=Hirsutella rhossiliensis TaxID=111463 RepID=A0A9P8N4V7_9HYPO|nr:c2H2 type zinc-finger (2 copies) domain-containing protein [Hirsutella rhossiliensis]KAH0966849.1 c2H2 type zinc-finger (2 copies) domain-containing protein [Hirsutella rhossiliensis]
MTDTGVVVDQPPLAIAQAPSFCRLCNVELSGLQAWRAHVKSDGHVYKLQLKVAEPGSVTYPPSADADQTKSAALSCARKRGEPDIDIGADQDQDVDSDTEDEPSAPDFVPGKCLFCAQESGILDDNLTHMAVAHGFSVSFQDCLAVDLETVVAYLHFVIHGYRECICCGTRRSTVEGAQHHMVAKGHCRFGVSPDTEEFYEMPQSENVAFQQTQRDGSIPNLEPLAEQHQTEIKTRSPYAQRPPRLLVSRSPDGGEGTEAAKSCAAVRPYLPRSCPS